MLKRAGLFGKKILPQLRTYRPKYKIVKRCSNVFTGRTHCIEYSPKLRLAKAIDSQHWVFLQCLYHTDFLHYYTVITFIVYSTLHIKLEINKIRRTWKLVKRLTTWNCTYRFNVEHKNTSILRTLLSVVLLPTLYAALCLFGCPFVVCLFVCLLYICLFVCLSVTDLVELSFLIETLSYSVEAIEGFSVSFNGNTENNLQNWKEQYITGWEKVWEKVWNML